jgi:hypothetical protein
MVFCYILWIFGIVFGNLLHFSRFGILYQEKSGNPGRLINSGGEKSKQFLGSENKTQK